jgi:sulfide dehydrogenase cytochrome subunit
MKITALCGAVAMTLLTAGTNVMAGPSGEMLSYTCAGCHGTDGSSVGPSSPHLAGMNQDYFTEAMQDYKDGKRNPTIMDRLAKGYTDEQIAAMAEFFAAQTLRLTPQEYDAAKAKVGAKLHDKYCEKCHEDGGTKADEAGVLAGQWAPYLRFTMADYLSGKREMSKKMAKKVEKMHKKDGDAGVDALIQYYSSKK